MAKLMDSDHGCSPSYNERFLKIKQKHMNALIEKGFTVTLEDVICELGLDPERNFNISFPELAGDPLISAADFGFTKENPKLHFLTPWERYSKVYPCCGKLFW